MCFIIAGIASSPTTVSVAPITPVEAAKMMHIRIVPIAMPPGSRLVHRWTALKSCSAIPERSSIEPMKTKSGTAASTKFEATLSTFCVNWKKTASPKA